MKKKIYEQPKVKVVELEQTESICQSSGEQQGRSVETYEDGSISGWY